MTHRSPPDPTLRLHSFPPIGSLVKWLLYSTDDRPCLGLVIDHVRDEVGVDVTSVVRVQIGDRTYLISPTDLEVVGA